MKASLAVISVSLFLNVAAAAETPVNIDNFQIVDAGLAIGGAPDAAALTWLQAQGYEVVIDLREVDDLPGTRAPVEAAGLDYFSLPASRSAPQPELVSKFVDLLNQNRERKVFLHCSSGRRAAALLKIYLVKELDRDPAGVDAELPLATQLSPTWAGFIAAALAGDNTQQQGVGDHE